MKNFTTVSVNGKMLLHLLILTVLSIFLVSCEKEEMDTPLENELAASAVIQGKVDYNGAHKKGAPAPGEDPIAAIAIEAGFDELVAALMYVDSELDAGLVDLFLIGTDQYTVFAPTNAAFQDLYSALGIDGITDLPAELVLEVLLYHVTDGRRAANSVVPPRNYKTIETLLGKIFKVDPNSVIMAIGNNANITTANISASNGIIHIIDGVLLPIE
ncbi:Uncaracterized surface protein containing fasciclin (FAS1) repeats [Salinimicrobium catena]|uniref:Uncaracterized surface protein containing fasciclin (FAS1) repeats n=1 Tax=Salinimicrobium catena TaxID=390640 RepID=A0A1H5NPB1_9FLAO|nr:fasciclin domain-containing protein [Salinimicrobium catena]SDL55820.1 Uncaracterized surface protein containing fasciclin (FAS1) repeats [Salinimicrobium catena]SEF03393.1 Uncaracterized surface protein containing fasciclin (FAS1) repeats [Salinimicrobium catena]